MAAAPALINSGGRPWTAAYVDTIGEPTADLRSNIAAEARAKIIYERLINVTDDPGVKEALGFLMTREIAHQKSFEKALYAIEPNFPPGKLPGDAGVHQQVLQHVAGRGRRRGAVEQRRPMEVVSDARASRPRSMAATGSPPSSSAQPTRSCSTRRRGAPLPAPTRTR